jgi:signal transduction histidine kinase
MTKSTEPSALDKTDVYGFLRRTLFWLRWGTLAVLLLFTFMAPTTSSVGLPTWALVVLFAGYNLLTDVLLRRLGGLRSLALGAMLDLPVAGVLYFLAGEPGGLLFILFLLAVDFAAASLTLRSTLFYTAAVGVIAIAIDLALGMWAMTPEDIRLLGARLLMLVLVGAGMAIVTRRLVMEQEDARLVRGEADRLEELERLRATFVANVSHDLRTPLTATRAALGMLETHARDRLLSDEQELLEAARRNTERLSLQIDDLLAHNQIEVGTLRLESGMLDLRAVVLGTIPVVHPLFQEKHQVLELDLPDPLILEGDPERLGQVVVNLLANAHRHTQVGSRILIRAELTAGEILLLVSDNGPGIPVLELERIFQRFHHLTSAGSSSGLGLAIARAVVELHGGRIWAESQSGQGATFWVALPRITPEDQQ